VREQWGRRGRGRKTERRAEMWKELRVYLPRKPQEQAEMLES
jgi:hypothetical protein